MSEQTEVEKRVQVVIDDIAVLTKNKAAMQRLYENLGVFLDKPKETTPKEYSTIWEALKLFLASVLGAVGGVLIDGYVKNPDGLLLVETILVLLGFSVIFVLITYWLPNWRRNKRKKL